MKAGAAVGVLLAFLASAGSLPAQTPLLRSGDFSLDLGGYALSLTGIHDAGFSLPSGESRSGFHSDVARLEWRARWGDELLLEAHDRVQVRVTTSTSALSGSVAGFGVSAVPGRAVDLESVWIDDDRLRAWHDVDRLALTVYTDLADVTVGRQAITWGTSLLFPVADLWAQFSPFELDTEEKPGADALRVLAYPARGLEVDGVVADRGSRGVSVGGRAAWSLASADVWAGAGRLWNEAMAMGGITWIFENAKLRGEAVVSRDLDRDQWLDPRITLGADWIGSRLSLTAEYHFNGLGAASASDYPARLSSASFQRGESYYLGRQYVGALASWAVDAQQRIHVSGSVLVNLGDPSAALLPDVSWDVGQAARISVGGLLTAGRDPSFAGAVPELRSEYGTYGSLGYGRMSIYF